MPRPRPPHLHIETTRHGRRVWYVRIGQGPRIRIKSEFGTAEFDAEYQAALSGNPRPKKGAPKTGTLAWLIDRYRDGSDWTGLSLATRKQRENIFKQVISTAGTTPYSNITEATIAAGRDRRKATPFQARHFIDAMRGLFDSPSDVRRICSRCGKGAHIVIIITAAAALAGANKSEGGLGHVKRRAVTLTWPRRPGTEHPSI